MPAATPITFQSTCQAIRSGEFLEWGEEEQTLGAELKKGRETPILWALQWHDLLPKIPPRFLTEEILLQEIANESGSIPDPPVLREIDRIIAKNRFDLLPPSVWTTNLLVRRRKFDGIAPIHLIAEQGLLSKLPKELLTEETLLIKTSWGTTPFKVACQHNIFQIPGRLLTEKTIRRAFGDEWPGSACRCLGQEAYRLERPHSPKILFETLPKKTFRLATLKEFRDYCQDYCTNRRFGSHRDAMINTLAWAHKEIQKEGIKKSLTASQHSDL